VKKKSAGGRSRSIWLLPAELLLTAGLSTGLYLLVRMEFVWVLGGLAAGWIVTALFRRAQLAHAPNATTRKTGQVLVGVGLGPVLAAQSMGEALPYLALLLAAVLMAFVGSVVVARAYAGMADVDPLTAGLATLPGGIGIMASVAAERGGSPTLVALVQGARVAVVVSIVPVILLIGGAPTVDHADVPGLLPVDDGGWLAWGLLLVGGFVAAAIATRLHVPVASLLGPMVLGLLAALLFRALVSDADALGVPYLHSVVGQALLGITVGEYLAQNARVTRRAAIGGMAGVGATMALSLLVAMVLALLTPWSFLTCVLMTAPGGAPEMIVLAAASPSDLHLVVIAQMSRQIAVNVLMPLWLRIFRPPPAPA
jgi:membrane AbrB-like protein